MTIHPFVSRFVPLSGTGCGTNRDANDMRGGAHA